MHLRDRIALKKEIRKIKNELNEMNEREKEGRKRQSKNEREI